VQSPPEPPKKSATATFTSGVASLVRGRINFGSATREAFRRGRAAVRSRRERATIAQLATTPVQLRAEFQSLAPSELLDHFRNRTVPSFLPGFQQPQSTATAQQDLFPDDAEKLISAAWSITREHRWPLLGFGDKSCGEEINWLSDPLSGRVWPSRYHADIPLWHNDGSDIRVLWELNRLGHLVTLGRAYAVTDEEQFAREFFQQLESWREQNPLGLGPNWSCAMEVALRAINVLAAFSLFRNSPSLTEDRLVALLTMLEQHGAHIRRNLEFSHLATSNHYLSDVAGLLWLGIMLPELELARGWRDWALPELLREMDKQILPDGADYEASTGYHRFVLELFLYSFVLCRANGVEIEARYWQKLRSMLEYLRAYLRPDGRAPLIGDTDGGQFLPLVNRDADDHAYLLAVGAALFDDESLNAITVDPAPEVLWVLGSREGLREFAPAESGSRVFRDAGTCVLRHDDLFLLLNVGGTQKGRPSSHRHNDLLSLEVSAFGRAFIVDPGTYVYTADLHERHAFRSTAYHSTLTIDDAEQMSISEVTPFVIGSAAAKILDWIDSGDREIVVAEHSGYSRLRNPVIHRRSVTFDKANRRWLIEDYILGSGEHKIATRFHFDAGLEVTVSGNSAVAREGKSGARFVVSAVDLDVGPKLEAQFTSRHYGSKLPSVSACWTTFASAPCMIRWTLVPVLAAKSQAV
jgi:hypothetical protein